MTAPIAGGGDLPGEDDNRGSSTTAPSGGHLFSLRAKVLHAHDLRRAHPRLAPEIVERNPGATAARPLGPSIRADYVGKNLPTKVAEDVRVRLRGVDEGDDGIEIWGPES